MEQQRNFISNNSLNLLTFLLKQPNFNKAIVLLGKGNNGKSYITNKCQELIESSGYKYIKNINMIKHNYFEDKNILHILDIELLNNIDINKYILINMNL